MKQKRYTFIGKILRNNNFLFTILIMVCNAIILAISESNKDTIVSLAIFFNGLIFFLYRYRVTQLVNRNWLSIKKELMYINYPVTIGAFFILIFLIFCADVYRLSTINKEALNATFIFTYFMSTISMLTPSMLLLVYIHLICPAFILPKLEPRRKNKTSDIIILILFIIFILFSFFQITSNAIKSLNLIKRDKYKAAKLPIQYSDKYLKYTDLSEPVIEKLQRQELKVPFLYTTEGFKFETYEAAEQFCKSMNAKVANHKEIYNVIFHRFDTFGEKYYWTSDKAGRNPIVLRFKDMSYEMMKKPEGVTPIAYCTSEASPKYKMFEQQYFYKIKPVEIESEKVEVEANKKFNIEKLNIGKDTQIFKKQKEIPQDDFVQDDTPRHINFNVKHAPIDYINELLNKGYFYEKHLKVNSYYESSESELYRAVNEYKEPNVIRLCYYPFSEYRNMNIQNESQIWKQSFCSPSFEVVNKTPQLKSLHEKEAFCYANDGRLPNIPELMGIIKTQGSNYTGNKFWINSRISQNYNQYPVAVTITDSQSILVEPINTNEQIYTFCVKPAKKSSKIISNFKSRFYGENGQSYAKTICPYCKYYEMPDTVLMR